ncbi:unnamed protein product [Euphydryas editha]|uniref:Uncharacterized protein n=1 Tax=Euphydryas editha TaxID=104508 RepID=A0AAU9VA40_EUPED|nr:unnamed protein product [Euphydryas editha]
MINDVPEVHDIDKVVKWSHNNKLYVNVAKCFMISFSCACTPLHQPYLVEGEPLKCVTEVRDLGVRFTADLNFRE